MESGDLKTLRILHLEDNVADAELAQSTLESDGIVCVFERVASKPAFLKALQDNGEQYDIILSDFSLPQFDGLAALALAREVRPDIPFLFLSGTIGEERAVESLKKGAADYIVKDRMQRLSAAIRRAYEDSIVRREKEKTEEQARQQAELLNQAHDAIFVRNLNQEITYWNKAAERLYGWTAAEIIGHHADEVLYKPGSPSREYIWKTVLETGEWSGELAQRTRSGGEIFVFTHRTLLRDRQGAPLAVLNINTDITHKKELEDQVLRSQRVESIGALAGGIAHDLNNVLAPIMMVTELLRDQIQDADNLRMLDMAKNSALRGADLVKQILQFARGRKAERSVVDIKELLREMSRLIQNTFPRMITFREDIPQNLAGVFGDATQIQQVLLNLCVNARDAMMPKGGDLFLQAQNRILKNERLPNHNEPVSGSFVELSVRDSGSGIPPEIIGKIFEPFFTTKSEGKGTGLGLATVQTIIRNHNGFLQVNSEVGKGTTFRVLLPAAGAESKSVSDDSGGDELAGRGEYILLVDDERALLEMTKELLEAYNYKTLPAASGAEALKIFDANRDKIAVVITDLHMPEISGSELIARISKEAPQIITVCTSGSGEGEVRTSDIPGCKGFLRKPCSTREMLAVLNDLLQNRRKNATL